MYYYDPNRNDARRWAAVAAALYALLLAAAFLFVSFDLGLDRIVPGEGILVDFGTTETGLGERDPRSADVQAPARPQRAATEVQPVEYETDERSEVAVQTPNPERRPRREQPAGERTQSGAAAEPAAEKPREVDRRALFPGRTAGSASASEGTSQGAGNAGDPSGAPEGSHEGTGQGNVGIDHDLKGREFVGELPDPGYPGNNLSGKVIIEVTVDESGKVIDAAPRAEGSTTGNRQLINAARAAALKTRFTQSEAVIQHGTITYVFKLNG